MSSTNLYYSQRLGKYSEVNPTIPMQLIILPIIMVQQLMPLFSLVLMATHFRENVLVCVLVILVANFLVLESPCLKKNIFRDIIFAFYDDQDELGKEERDTIFWKAVLTSWVAPCTFWKNSSYFLIVQSLTTMCLDALGIVATLLYDYHADWSKIVYPPVIHCSQLLKNISRRYRYILANITMSTIPLKSTKNQTYY